MTATGSALPSHTTLSPVAVPPTDVAAAAVARQALDDDLLVLRLATTAPADAGDGANLWNAVHIRDVASVFRLALEKGPPASAGMRLGTKASRSARSPRPSTAAWACPS